LVQLLKAKGKAVVPRGELSRWRQVVCILLIGLLLYNPFLALLQTHAGLSLNHLPRNRATVGASELDHFSPVSKTFTAEILAVECAVDIAPLLPEIEFPLATTFAPAPVSLCDFSSSLWFRPPPSA
jgi:hypothetical protein